MILKQIIWDGFDTIQNLIITKVVLKKNKDKVKGTILPDFKYFIIMFIKTMQKDSG